ncbi:MAG: lamin tail domain-containing protein [Patescibacteria group bacterium]
MSAKQNYLIKIFLSFLIASAIFLFLPEKVLAQVVINELLPNPTDGPDWVELYNSTGQDINLNNWILDDEGTTTNMVDIKEATISAKGFLVFEVGSRLNKSSDTIYLKDDHGSTIDEYQYTKDPGTGVSYGRMPDGGDWGICQVPTKGGANSCVVPTPTPEPEEVSEPTPTPTPLPTPLPTPTPTPTPTKKPTPTPTLIPTPTGEILGEEATPSAEEAPPTPEVLGETTKNPSNLLPKILIGTGTLLLLISGGFLLFPKIRGYNGKNEEIPPLG